MFIVVEDVSGVIGVVALGISGIVYPRVSSVVALGVTFTVAFGITGVVSSVFPYAVFLGYSISVPGECFLGSCGSMFTIIT